MEKPIKPIIFFLAGAIFAFGLLLSGAESVSAKGLVHISDRLSDSGPSASSSHEIKFLPTVDIPAGGRIVFTPAPGEFFIPAEFSSAEVDFATSSSLGGEFIDREVSALVSTSTDGVAVTSGANGRIAITLNSSAGVSAGTAVKLVFGRWAASGEAGQTDIINPAAPGSYSYQLDFYDAADHLIAGADYLKVAIVAPVSMTGYQTKIRFNGAPSGFLAYGTTQTYMSLQTNYVAHCRYSIASGTAYADMTDNFEYTDAFFHSRLLTGLWPAEYNFYIRCLDTKDIADDTDYLINFTIKAQGDSEGTGEGSEGGEETGGSGSGGGGSGGGGGGGFGNQPGPGTGDLQPYPPLPPNPIVSFSGWAYPNASISILKDGVKEKTAMAAANAAFSLLLDDLKEGVYTFGLQAKDSDGRESLAYTTTFALKEGTKSVLANIILPPTIAVSATYWVPGDSLSVSGQSAPGGQVEIWLYPEASDLNSDKIVKQTVTAASDGRWQASFSSQGLDNGQYIMKARTGLSGIGTSDFGTAIKLSLGEKAPLAVCAGADLNGDGRVNITDFSILLYWWNSDNACADQNHDGRVNLIDFSIMMYHWTG